MSNFKQRYMSRRSSELSASYGGGGLADDPTACARFIVGVLKGHVGTKANLYQSVRRKGGKKGKGHVYIICNLNPKHKQRQG